MLRQIAVAVILALGLAVFAPAPASAAFEFYVRIQGPKPSKPSTTANLKAHGAAIAFEYTVPAVQTSSGGAGAGKVKFGDITIKDEMGPTSSFVPANSAAATTPSPKPGGAAAPALVREVVRVGCDGFDVQADFGRGPVRGVLASQSVDGSCIFGVVMPSAAANAIVRIGLRETPPGWSFNGQPQSKCMRSGDTLDGTLGGSPGIFSFQWGAARSVAMLPSGPCGKS
jgi:hypothetical protein